ncbi:hypothetical protein TELCIR_17653, partial [Teladorsagia circumcincta]
RSDSERRQALLSLFDYFFNRSHKFRLRTVEKLQAVDFDSASAELLAERLRKEAEDRRSAELSQKVVAHVRRKLDEVKDDIERCIASADTALSILVPVFCTDFDEDTTKNSDSTSDPSTAQELQEKQDEVKPAIPVVSYGLDLKYWGEQRSEAPIPRNNADCHRFWRAPEDDDRDLEAGSGKSFVSKPKKKKVQESTVRERLEMDVRALQKAKETELTDVVTISFHTHDYRPHLSFPARRENDCFK